MPQQAGKQNNITTASKGIDEDC